VRVRTPTGRGVCMNLSPYQPVDPNVNRGDRKERFKAGNEAFPVDHQVAYIIATVSGAAPIGFRGGIGHVIPYGIMTCI